MPHSFFDSRRLLALIVAMSLGATIACSTTTIRSAGEAVDEGDDTESDDDAPSEEEAGTTNERDAGGAKPPKPDAGSKAGVFPITGAHYVRRDGTFAVDFKLTNDSSDSITSIEKLSFDFGDGDVVTARNRPCYGAFSLDPGGTADVETAADFDATTGEAGQFSFYTCPKGTNLFIGGSGQLPTAKDFQGPVTIHVSGTTSVAKSFTTKGVATLSP